MEKDPYIKTAKSSSKDSTIEDSIKKTTLAVKYDIYFYDEVVHDTNFYIPLVELLRDASPSDEVNIHLKSPGGSVSSGQVIIQAITSCEAPVIMHIDGACYSMAALIALAGDGIVFRNGTYLMFHTYSGGERGKSNEIESHVKSSLKSWKLLLNLYCQPFLKKKEIQQLLDGKDLYFHPEEADTQQRIARHYK